MRVDDLVAFIEAREQHRKWKIVGEEPHAWRNRKRYDPIIAQYRFCNVRRNDDRVTMWIHEHILDHWRDHSELWFFLTVARLFNLPSSLMAILDLLDPFKPALIRNRLHKRKKEGKNNFNAAYIVSTNGRTMDKVDYVVAEILGPLWADRKAISKKIHVAPTLDEVHRILMDQNGLASFMAAQVVADLKYAHPDRWKDFHTFAASGPGSKRGLNYVMDAPPDKPWKEEAFRETLGLLRLKVNAKLRWPEPLTAHDIQNCLCEFSKYERTRLGEGRPKQKYVPHMETLND